MRVKTKIAILNGDLKAKPDSKDWPIKTDGRVEKGVTLTAGEHVSAALAKDWVERGKAVAEEEKAGKPVDQPKA